MLYMEVLKSWEIVEFPKISIKIRNCKIFYLNRSKQRATLGKSFCVNPNDPPLDKVLLREIYRHFLSTFPWASRNGAVQMFFLTSSRNMFAGKILSQKGFWLYCRSVSFWTPSELRFVKWVRFFERNCIVKWVIFFASFVGFETFC